MNLFSDKKSKVFTLGIYQKYLTSKQEKQSFYSNVKGLPI